MGLFSLLFAFFEALGDTIRENRESRIAEEERRRYEDIDFDNIARVTFDGTVTAYRIEAEEEFDPVATDFLTRQDGWQHYETQTVEYEVEDGEDYCFTIKYKDGTEIYRKFHESSLLTKRLLEYCNKKDASKTNDISCEDLIVSRYNEILGDSLELLETTVNSETFFSRYKIALDNAKRILETTSSQHYRDYASKIITDLTENRTEKIKNFIYRCNRDGRLYSVKDQLLSDNYDIPFEAKEYLNSLLKEKEESSKRRIAIIDFETTGLVSNFHKADHDEIISVAIIDQDENVLLDTYCDTMHKTSWDEAERIHGISPSDIKGYPTFVDILPQVIEILTSYDYVIAYNAKFERGFLFNYASHYANDLDSALKIHWGNDPMDMFKDYMNLPKYSKLVDAAEHFGYTFKAHNALEDTKAAWCVYKTIWDIWTK